MALNLTTFPTNRADADETKWSALMSAKFRDGIYKSLSGYADFEVFADATGMQVKVRSGMVCMGGFDAQLSSQVTLALAASNATNPRIDRVVLRLDKTAPSTIILDVLTGTPAQTPTVPTLTNNSTVRELPLAQVRVNATVGTIIATNVTDERTYTAPRGSGNTMPGAINGVGSPGTGPFLAFDNHTHPIDENAIRKLIIPAGFLFAAGHAAVETGFLPCDGRLVSRLEFSRLFSKWGTKYGAGDGSTTFGLPNLTGLVLRGSTSGQGVGVIGGADSVTLWHGMLPLIAPAVDGDSGNRVIVTSSPPGGWFLPNVDNGGLRVSVSDIDEFGRATPDPINVTQRSIGVNWMVST